MRVKKGSRQKVLSFKVTPGIKTAIEQIAAALTTRRGERHTLTDVVEESVRLLAKREKVEVS